MFLYLSCFCMGPGKREKKEKSETKWQRGDTHSSCPGLARRPRSTQQEVGGLLFVSSPTAEGYGFVHAHRYSSQNLLVGGATLVLAAGWRDTGWGVQ